MNDLTLVYRTTSPEHRHVLCLMSKSEPAGSATMIAEVQTSSVARRIVALWNAAEELDLTTEEIEAGAIQAGAKALDARDRKKAARILKEQPA